MKWTVGLMLALVSTVLVAAPERSTAAAPNGAALAAPHIQPLKFSRILIRLKEGQVWAKEGMAGICDLTVYTLKWNATQSKFPIDRAAAAFDEEVAAAGLQASQSANLFDEAPTNHLEVGVVVTDLNAQFCGFEDDAGRQSVRGTMQMTAEWQVYDPIRREIVARIVTTARGEEKNRSFDGKAQTFLAALKANAQLLFANSDFRNAISASPGATATTGKVSTIQFDAGQDDISVADAVGSVVSIFAGDVLGSGFLVSRDGYLLTNQHVVGSSSTVRVRWSDGFETQGEVVRSNKGRDVALVKTVPHGRSPLRLNLTVPRAGAPVFAIGTPLDPHLQGTVTRGVVSAQRIVDGFSFIQSDAPVSHGNSGGPLLDEGGAVVGLTDWGVSPQKGSSLNFFIPIGDALDFLALKASEAPAQQATVSASKARAKP